MNLPRRLRELYRMKARAARTAAGDMPETAGDLLGRYRELLAQVRQAVADLADSGQRLDRKIRRLRKSADELQAQARREFAAGGEDLAREAVIRRSAVLSEIDELERRQSGVRDERDTLAAGLRRLEAAMTTLRNHRTGTPDGSARAHAETGIREALAGIADEMAEVDRILRRARAAAAEADAGIRERGQADRFDTPGSGTDSGGEAGPFGDIDSLQAQLDEISRRRDVEEELARLKRMGTSDTPPRRGGQP
jgi:phage shock protein A